MFVDVTGYLNILKKDLQGKDKLTGDMADNVKAFKVNLRLSIKSACLFTQVHTRQTFQP
jgi:hypothetical protein